MIVFFILAQEESTEEATEDEFSENSESDVKLRGKKKKGSVKRSQSMVFSSGTHKESGGDIVSQFKKRKGLNTIKVRFDITLHSINHLPSKCVGKNIQLTWKRGSKAYNTGKTDKFQCNGSTISLGASISIQCSLYQHQQPPFGFEEQNILFSIRYESSSSGKWSPLVKGTYNLSQFSSDNSDHDSEIELKNSKGLMVRISLKCHTQWISINDEPIAGALPLDTSSESSGKRLSRVLSFKNKKKLNIPVEIDNSKSSTIKKTSQEDSSSELSQSEEETSSKKEELSAELEENYKTQIQQLNVQLKNENEKFEKQIKEKQDEIDQLKLQNRSTNDNENNQISNYQNQIEDLNKQLDELKKSNNKIEKSKKSLKSKNADLNQQIELLNSSLSDSKEQLKLRQENDSDVVSKTQELLDEKIKENEKLKNENQKLKSENDQFSSNKKKSKKKLSSLQTQITSLTTQISSLSDADNKNKSLEENNKKLQENNQRNQEEIQKLNENIKKLEENQNQSNQSNSIKESEFNDLKKQLSSKNKDFESLKLEKEKLSKKKSSQSKKLREIQRSIDSLKNENEKLKNENSLLLSQNSSLEEEKSKELLNNDHELLENQITQLKNENEKLKTEKEKLTKKKSSQSKKLKDLTKYKQENENLTEQLNQLQQSFDQLQNDNEKINQKLTENENMINELHQNHRDELRNLKAQINQENNSNENELIGKYQNEIQELEDEIHSLKDDQRIKNDKIQENQNEIEQLNSKLLKLSKENESKDNERSLNSITNEVTIQQLNKKLEKYKEKFSDVETKNQELEENNKNLHSQIDQFQNEKTSAPLPNENSNDFLMYKEKFEESERNSEILQFLVDQIYTCPLSFCKFNGVDKFPVITKNLIDKLNQLHHHDEIPLFLSKIIVSIAPLTKPTTKDIFVECYWLNCIFTLLQYLQENKKFGFRQYSFDDLFFDELPEDDDDSDSDSEESSKSSSDSDSDDSDDSSDSNQKKKKKTNAKPNFAVKKVQGELEKLIMNCVDNILSSCGDLLQQPATNIFFGSSSVVLSAQYSHMQENRELVFVLENIFKKIKISRVCKEVSIRLLEGIFEYINALIFNELLRDSKYCTAEIALNIKLILSQLVDWLASSKLLTSISSEDCFNELHLRLMPLTHCVNALVILPNGSVDEFSSADELFETFSSISAPQLLRLVNQFTSTYKSQEQIPETIKQMIRKKAKEADDTTLFLEYPFYVHE